MNVPKNKPVRSKRYLKWIDEQPCIISGQKATHHHIRSWWTDHGTSQKPSDIYAIPLSPEHHTDGNYAIHRGKMKFMVKNAITEEGLMRFCLDLIRRFLAEGNKF